MEIIEGATATLTAHHLSVGRVDTSLSIASLSISIPVALDTCVEPRYCARRTFFGSSMGVGNDWARKYAQNRIYTSQEFLTSI